MRNLVDLFVRFSHVFFISHCCNNAPNDEIIPPSLLQEETRREAESPPESIQERISSREEAKNGKEVLEEDQEFYDVQLD